MFFVLFAVFTLYLSWQQDEPAGTSSNRWLAAESLMVLLISVLLHDMGHAIAAFRLGGHVDQIIVGPVGGLGVFRDMPDARSELWTHLAGPAVQIAICLFCLPVLITASINPIGLMHPLGPVDLTIGSSWLVLVKLLFWINWCLLLLNLIPAFPLDGGRALAAALLIKWPRIGKRGAALAVSGLAKVLAVALFVSALLLDFGVHSGLFPIQFALVLLAIFLFFGAKQQELRAAEEEVEEDLLMGMDIRRLDELEAEFASTKVERHSPLRRWLDHRRALRLRRKRELEQAEELRVDEILARLHERGMHALSAEDREILDRVSARLRSRLSS